LYSEVKSQKIKARLQKQPDPETETYFFNFTSDS
jgi:hypothetical protein